MISPASFPRPPAPRGARAASPVPRACWLAVALLATLGCRYDPKVPEGRVVCLDDRGCPSGLTCVVSASGRSGVCCRDGRCGAGAPSPGPGVDASVPPAPDAGEPDPEIAPPPSPGMSGGPSTPGGGVDGGDDEPSPDASPGAPPKVSCTTPIEKLTIPDNGEALCSLYFGNRSTTIFFDVMPGNDPVNVRTLAHCSSDLTLPTTALPPGATPPAVDEEIVDSMIEVAEALLDRCETLRGRVVGGLAGSWARAAGNLAQIRDRLREDLELTLDVPSEDDDRTQRYLSVTRNRLGRVVLSDWSDPPDILYWSPGATAPSRAETFVSYEQAEAQFLAHPAHASFESARRALRAMLHDQLRPFTVEMQKRITARTLAPQVVVGPTDPSIPLAVKGSLRGPSRDWDPPAAYQAKVSGVLLTSTGYGRTYGLLLPGEVDTFYSSLTPGEFMQLRTEPIRSAYGGYIMLATVLLDILADEGGATEFGYVYTNTHFGWLFQKLAGPPR